MVKKVVQTVIVLLLMPILFTGCFFGEKPTSMQIDPPPQDAASGKMNAQAVQGQQQNAKNGVEMYFLSDAGYVVPYTLSFPNVKGIAKETMKYMVQGGPGENLLPQGFSCLLPKGTEVRGLSIQDGVATIDFSKQLLNYDAKMEEKLLNAVTWTLTGFGNVDKVNIWVEGKPLSVMPKGKTTAQGLTRDRGINLEVLEGVNIGQSVPVTLYFLGQTATDQIYYVPVTRMVNRTDQVAQATLKELIKGPAPHSNLVSALANNIEVNDVAVKGDTVTADLGDQLLGYNEQKAASKTAINSIIFSLTENTTAKKVKIMVNGKAAITVSGSSNSTMDKPVSRPKNVNPTAL